MDFITVFASPQLDQVYFVKSLLESSGIEVHVLDEAIGHMAPHHLFGTGGTRLAVKDSDKIPAQEIIKDYQNKLKNSND